MNLLILAGRRGSLCTRLIQSVPAFLGGLHLTQMGHAEVV